MPRPKKVIIEEEVKEAEETIIETVNPRLVLEERLAYLRDLREKLVNEGVDTIGKLDVLTSKVIQELESL